jgi:hypothetical protein
VVRNIGDVDRYLGQVRDAAAKIHAWIVAQTGEPLDLLRRMKFGDGRISSNSRSCSERC